MSTGTKVFGCPGSGKTAHLLGVVENILETGTPSEKIGFFSFTRKAAYEARDRAIRRFPKLDPKLGFPYFRTLHSLAFYCLGISPKDMMTAENYKEFALEAQIDLGLYTEEEEFMVHADNPILNEINLARIKGLDLHTHYNQSRLQIEWFHFEFVERTYRHYKATRNLLDFTDLLEMIVLRHDDLPHLDTVFIDEAQDLSRLQWSLVRLLFKKCNYYYLAGDDEQAIFNWAGADVQSFLDFPAETKLLEHSHRIPAKVHALATLISSRIRVKQEKKWTPREEEGSLHYHNHFQYVDVTEGEWLILASTNYLLNDLHEWLKSQGLLFERRGQRSIPEKILEAVVGWERLRAGKEVNYQTVKLVYSHLDPLAVKRGYRTLLHVNQDAMYDMATLREKHGLLTDAIWHEALTKIDASKRNYLVAILRRGGKLSAPQIKLSTIHGAKGGEADNVMLLMDLSPRFAMEYSINSDNINRLFYVGITRAKQSLHLIRPKDLTKGFQT